MSRMVTPKSRYLPSVMTSHVLSCSVRDGVGNISNNNNINMAFVRSDRSVVREQYTPITEPISPYNLPGSGSQVDRHQQYVGRQDFAGSRGQPGSV